MHLGSAESPDRPAVNKLTGKEAKMSASLVASYGTDRFGDLSQIVFRSEDDAREAMNEFIARDFPVLRDGSTVSFMPIPADVLMKDIEFSMQLGLAEFEDDTLVWRGP